MIIHAGLSDRGKKRPINQDRWAADSALGLFIVADGMSTAAPGELAAQLVLETLPVILRRHLRGLRDLADPRALEGARATLQDLNRRLRFESRQHPTLEGMGSTVLGALVWKQQALIAHLGDSRAYLLRDGALEQLTRDHSTVQEMLDREKITPDQVPSHRASGRLTGFIGMTGEAQPEARSLKLAPGDRLLLCSNGVWDMLSATEIGGILQLAVAPAEACRRLIDAANLAGGADNITALVIALT